MKANRVIRGRPSNPREPIYKVIGERIARARVLADITQSELGAPMGLTRAAVANMEGGKQRILLHHAIQIAERLGLSVNKLCGVKFNASRATEAAIRRAEKAEADASRLRERLSEIRRMTLLAIHTPPRLPKGPER